MDSVRQATERGVSGQVVVPRLLIGGFVLPAELVQVMESGRWKPPDMQVLREVFDDDPDDPRFYDLPSMARQDELLRAQSPEVYRDLVGPECDIDPSRCLVVGDLGVDMSIALHYGADGGDPRVIYLTVDGWREVAPNVRVLVERLRL
ncbi:hypothetical protein ACGFIE_28560 [Micromonospora sp. NPDC049275]|uniref:hypothetical protein n=1 Tax=Micromonospora sp. NPDC049275 TaxID=3364268 RepID=UPI00371D07EB